MLVLLWDPPSQLVVMGGGRDLREDVLRLNYEPLERDPLRPRVTEDRFEPLLLDEEDDVVRLRVGELRALLFLAGVFRAEVFLTDDGRADDFLAGDFRALLFFAVFAFEFRFAGDLLFADDFLTFRWRSRARAVPPTAAPSAAAPVATNIGFSATVLATFFAPDPTAEAASPAFSATVEIIERPSFTAFRLVCSARAIVSSLMV